MLFDLAVFRRTTNLSTFYSRVQQRPCKLLGWGGRQDKKLSLNCSHEEWNSGSVFERRLILRLLPGTIVLA
jgi:hypothetical protein